MENLLNNTQGLASPKVEFLEPEAFLASQSPGSHLSTNTFLGIGEIHYDSPSLPNTTEVQIEESSRTRPPLPVSQSVIHHELPFQSSNLPYQEFDRQIPQENTNQFNQGEFVPVPPDQQNSLLLKQESTTAREKNGKKIFFGSLKMELRISSWSCKIIFCFQSYFFYGLSNITEILDP